MGPIYEQSSSRTSLYPQWCRDLEGRGTLFISHCLFLCALFHVVCFQIHPFFQKGSTLLHSSDPTMPPWQSACISSKEVSALRPWLPWFLPHPCFTGQDTQVLGRSLLSHQGTTVHLGGVRGQAGQTRSGWARKASRGFTCARKLLLSVVLSAVKRGQ